MLYHSPVTLFANTVGVQPGLGCQGFTDPFSLELNKFLDDFLLSRLGCNMLMGQYLACTNRDSHITSIVNPQCDALEICQKAADEVILGSFFKVSRTGTVRFCCIFLSDFKPASFDFFLGTNSGDFHGFGERTKG